MKYSQLFTKTQKFAPSDEVAKNAQLLIRGGYIHKGMAGVYDMLPLGLRVLEKIEGIVREEMNAIGGQELHLASLQSPDPWSKTNRWEHPIWFKTKLEGGADLGLGFTHEEPLTRLMTEHVHSYKDLPQYVYQFQTKFRNEARAKSGILRGREFLMKDLYSFSRSEEEHNDFYERAKAAYFKVFERVGLGENTFITFASGGVFSKYSHEFQTLSDAGEDTIYLDRKKKIAINKEVLNDDTISELGLVRDELEEVKAIEVGNIFSLGTRFSEPLELFFETEKGERKPVIMGSYGIGIGRIMGTVVEAHADDRGIVWPASIAPFQVHLVHLGDTAPDTEGVYKQLSDAGIEVFWDDREKQAGEKFADADLLGMPHRVVVSEKTLAQNAVELGRRDTGEVELVPIEDIIAKLQ